MPPDAGRLAVIFSVELPEVVTGFGVNEALVLDGGPEMLRVTELLLPTLTRLTVRLPLEPRFTVSDAADREIVKSAAGTFTVTDVLWVGPLLPSLPVIVSM